MKPVESVIDSEWALLSALIHGGAHAHHEAKGAGLRESHFRDPATWLCYRTLSGLLDTHAAIDRPMLRKSLKDAWANAERKPGITSDTALTTLYDGAWTSTNVLHHTRRITKAAMLTAAQGTFCDLAEVAPDWDGDGASFLAEAQRRLFSIESPAEVRGKMLSDLIPRLWEKLETEYDSPSQLRGLSTGIPTLNRMTRGLCPGQLWIVAGKTGHGKTALAATVALHAALSAPGGTFSFEMDWEELCERYIFTFSGISSQRWRDKVLTPSERSRLREMQEKLARLPLWVDDDGSITISEIVSRLRYNAFQGNCRWAVVDYTQLISADDQDKQSKQSRELEVRNIVRFLKNVARELKITLIALSQLNDQGEARESRAIEQFADIFLEIRLMDDLNAPDFSTREELNYDLLVRKCRGGRRGKIPMLFFPAQTRFMEVEVNHDPTF